MYQQVRQLPVLVPTDRYNGYVRFCYMAYVAPRIHRNKFARYAYMGKQQLDTLF